MTKSYNKPQLKNRRRELRRIQTATEEVVWLQIRNRKLLGLKFKRQYSIDKYVVDFYCPEHKIALEIDGSIHLLDEIKEYDKKRQKHLETFGITFIRVQNVEIESNSEKAFTMIEDEIKEIINSLSCDAKA